MPPKNLDQSDIIRVRHMIDAAKEAISFIKDKSQHDLEHDRKLALSLIKETEIIGEAASKISPSFRNKHPDIPWDIVIGTRNRLIHGYFDINTDIVWKTVTLGFPALIEQLEKIILPDTMTTS